MKVIMSFVCFIFGIFTLYAEIQSTVQGGYWQDSATWVQGIIPGADDDVVINGSVIIQTNQSCHNLTLANSASIIKNGSNNFTLSVNGNLVNNGWVYNNPNGYNLSVNLYGNLDNRFNFRPQNLSLLGNGNRTLKSVPSYPLGFVETFSIAATIDTVFALSDLWFDSGYTITGNNHKVVFDLYNELTSEEFDLNVNTAVVLYLDIRGNSSSVVNGNSGYWENTSISDALFTGIIKVTDGCIFTNITNQGNIYNHPNNNHNLTLSGPLSNYGQICNSPNGYDLHLSTDGNISNFGYFRPSTLNLTGSGNRTLACDDSHPFSPINTLSVATAIDTIFANTNLTFSNINKITGYFVLAGFSNSRLPKAINMTNLTLEYCEVAGISGSTLYLGTVIISAGTISNESISGNFSIMNNSIFNNISSSATLQNHYNNNHTLTIYGDFLNYGTVQNSPNGYNLSLNVYNSFLNYGTCSNYTINMYGSTDQYLDFAENHSFKGTFFNDFNSVTKLISVGNLLFENTQIDLNGATLQLPEGDYYLKLSGCTFREASLISDLTNHINPLNNTTITSVNFQSITNDGVFMPASTIIFSGALINNGTIQNHHSSNYSLYVYGSLTNSGTIRNNPSGYNFYTYIKGDVTNYGTWNNNSLFLNGDFSQTIKFPLNHPFAGLNFTDQNGGSPIVTADDFYFENCTIDLNNASLDITLADTDIHFYNCTFNDTQLISALTNAIHYTGSCLVQNVVFQSIMFYGTVNLASNITITGSLTNWGTIQNHSSNNFSLFIQGNLENTGEIRNNPSGYNLSVSVSQNLANTGNFHPQNLYLQGIGNQYLSNHSTFSPAYLYGSNTSSIFLMSDLEISNSQIDLNYANLNLVYGLNPYKFTLHGGYLREANIHGIGGGILKTDSNAYLSYLTADKLITEGTLIIGSEISVEHLTNYAVLKNNTDNNHTLSIQSRFDNYGTILNNTSYIFEVSLAGDLYNYGSIANYYLTFSSSGTQKIYQSPTADSLKCYQVRKLTATGNLQMLSDLKLKNCILDLNSHSLLMFQDHSVYNLWLYGGYLNRVDLATNGYSNLTLLNNAYLANVTGRDVKLYGTIFLINNTVFDNAINYGTIKPLPGYSLTLTILGNFTNYGTTQNGSGANLDILCQQNMSNYGTMSNYQLQILGYHDQYIQLNGTETITYFTLYTNMANIQWFRNGIYSGFSVSNLTLPVSSPSSYA